MLVIRQQQIDALIKGSDEEFVDFLVEHVCEEFPEKTAERDDETLRTMVRGGIRRAERHGFTTAEDTTAFISIMFEIAPNFDEQPQIKPVLDDRNFAPGDRFERLWSPLVPDEAWEEAENNYSENAWFNER
ncbi:MAG TPA: hypothetical protein VGC97_07815 [Pyrinomonadaceae bacterium]|jgi:hypothetical protein